MARYASHIWKPFDFSGGAYTGGPKKFGIHRTEGSTAAGAFAAYADGGVPHFTWELPSWGNGGRKWQHIDTSVAASALRNESGGVQTNRDGVIQVEIVGFSKDTRYLSDADLKWLGDAILEVCEREGIDWRKAPTFYDELSGFTLATPTARQRFSYAAWDAFDGVCGHQHVPENSHWDPGALDYPRLQAFMSASQGDELDMADLADVRAIVREENQRLAQYLAMGEGNAAFPTDVWGRGVTNPELPALVAQAVVAALPGGTVDSATVEAAVRKVFADAGTA